MNITEYDIWYDEMYDKYETFNLYLYQIAQSGAFSITAPIVAAAPSSAPFLLVDVRLKGLPFLNNTYSNFTRNNTDTVLLTSYVLVNTLPGGAGVLTPMFNPTIFTFGKTTENVNITIDMRCTNNQSYPNIIADQSFGTFSFFV